MEIKKLTEILGQQNNKSLNVINSLHKKDLTPLEQTMFLSELIEENEKVIEELKTLKVK